MIDVQAVKARKRALANHPRALHKRCSKCGVSKDASQFFSNRVNRDGLYSYCKACCRIAGQAFKAANREARLAAKRASYHARKQDARFMLNKRMSALVRVSLKRRKQGARWLSLVDYSLDDLREHLERQFVRGMGWHNMQDWHIDHIVPRAAFACDSPAHPDFKALWSLSNLRPVWAADNLLKHRKRTFLL